MLEMHRVILTARSAFPSAGTCLGVLTSPVFQPALGVEGIGVSGAEFPGWTVVVVKPGRTSEQPITYTTRAAGKQQQLLMGLPADRGVRIALGGKELVFKR
jgi:hypothetical protein